MIMGDGDSTALKRCLKMTNSRGSSDTSMKCLMSGRSKPSRTSPYVATRSEFKYEHRNKYETQQSLTAQIDRQQAEIEMLQKKYQTKCECFDRATEYIQQQKRKIKRLLEKS